MLPSFSSYAMKIYCNHLGMLIEFSYCTITNEGLPCRNIIGCWGKRTDIISFLRRQYTLEELRKVFEGLPKSRLERIIELLTQD